MAAEANGYDALLTIDHGFMNQQNMSERTIGVQIIETHPSTRARLLSLVPEIEEELSKLQAGTIQVLKGKFEP